MFENILYDKENGLFFNAKGKEIGWINKKGYKCLTINRKEVKAHRLAWYKIYGEMPNGEIDHINGNRADNRIENLRQVSRTQNMRNLKCHREGKIPCIKKRWNKFAVYIQKNGVRKYLGLFKTEEEARDVVMLNQ